MGFESCLLLNHDTIDTRDRNSPSWGNLIRDAILNPGQRPFRFSLGTVLYTDHRDSAHLLVTGGLQGIRLAAMANRELLVDTQVTLLKIAAEHLGYRLVKKPDVTPGPVQDFYDDPRTGGNLEGGPGYKGKEKP